MKKLFLLLVLSASTAHSQIVVDKPTKDSIVFSSPYPFLELVHFYGNGSHYGLFYKNIKYEYITEIDHISFSDEKEAIQFFNLLLTVFESGEFTSFSIAGDSYYIGKRMNQLAVYDHADTTEFRISKKVIDKMLEALNK